MSTNITLRDSRSAECEAPNYPLTKDRHTCCLLASDFLPNTLPKIDHQLASIQQIVDGLILHHNRINEILDETSNLFKAVLTNHKNTFPELERASIFFTLLVDEFQPHLLKEERVLFPFVVRLEKTVELGLRSLLSPFAGLHNPLRVMTVEHEATEDLFKDLRSSMRDFAVPNGACAGYALLCGVLRELESFLEQHFALEQKILYPRAMELESRIDLNG